MTIQAVQDTGLGNIEDKVARNYRKTLPLGVIAAVTPSTQKIYNFIKNIINAIKCRNAIIIAPSLAAAKVVCILTYIHHELDFVQTPRAGANAAHLRKPCADTSITATDRSDYRHLLIKKITLAAQSGTLSHFLGCSRQCRQHHQ
ncbi:MAG: hypothetical protein ACSLEN_04605 [Candidatus Malihini olakiniferum]